MLGEPERLVVHGGPVRLVHQDGGMLVGALAGAAPAENAVVREQAADILLHGGHQLLHAHDGGAGFLDEAGDQLPPVGPGVGSVKNRVAFDVEGNDFEGFFHAGVILSDKLSETGDEKPLLSFHSHDAFLSTKTVGKKGRPFFPTIYLPARKVNRYFLKNFERFLVEPPAAEERGKTAHGSHHPALRLQRLLRLGGGGARSRPAPGAHGGVRRSGAPSRRHPRQERAGQAAGRPDGGDRFPGAAEMPGTGFGAAPPGALRGIFSPGQRHLCAVYRYGGAFRH